MKKILILLSLVFLLTGCSLKEIDKSDIDTVIEDAISQDTDLSNMNSDGYKYYLPNGMKIMDKFGYNTKIVDKNNIYYLYVDLISYYHKTKTEYNAAKDAYFSKSLKFKDKEGYIEINNDKKSNKYFLEIMYNYAKVEAYVEKRDLKEAITSSIHLLSSVKINDAVLETLIGENILDYQEEQLDIFESKREEGAFLEVLKEYDKWNKKEEETKDEDIILPDSNE